MLIEGRRYDVRVESIGLLFSVLFANAQPLVLHEFLSENFRKNRHSFWFGDNHVFSNFEFVYASRKFSC